MTPLELASAVIAPVPPGTSRPRWSVMIPTFNCAVYLRETLASVLAQAPGAEAMQIEVVDDCSTKDDPAAIVREIGGGRVAFYRRPANGGATVNFNTCLSRSRGHLVHVLHGDDLVEPTFYSEIGRAEETSPNLALYACRSFVVDEAGGIEQISPRCPSLESPVADGRPLWYDNLIPAPGVVVRRSFVERHGGFSPDFCHVADWEMWWRALSRGGGLQLNRPLARYRFFSGNDTGRLARTAENLRDFLRLADLIQRTEPAFELARFRAHVAHLALEQTVRFETLGDAQAARANMQLWLRVATPRDKLRMFLLRPHTVLRRLRPRTA